MKTHPTLAPRPFTRAFDVPAASNRENDHSCHSCYSWAFFVLAIIEAAPDPIPELKPPRGEISATLWESHGLVLVAASVIALLLVFMLIREWRKAKPVPVEWPADIARRDLQRLRSRLDPAETLLATSSALRRYLVARFALPGPGLTADEITTSIPADPALATQLHRFLSDCDLVKFAPGRGIPPPEPIIHDAIRLVDAVERRSPPPLPLA